MRIIPTSMLATIAQPVINPIHLVRIDFDSGVAAWNSGFRDLTYDGIVFRAVGHLGSISSVQESSGIKASSVNLILSGIKPEIVSLIKDQPFLDRKCKIYLALTDEQFNFNSDNCVMIFSGSLDGVNIEIGLKAQISISVKSRLADWERPRKLRYTDADQQKLHPGDTGMRFIPQLSQKKLIWPRAAFLPDPRD